MKSGKTNAIWLGVAVFIAVVCLAGGSLMIASFAGGVKKAVESRKQENEATTAIEQNVRKLLDGKELGPRPKFPDTSVGRMQEVAYDYLESQVARQKTFMTELENIKFDWVMSPESLRTEANLDESLTRLAKARELANWFYTGLDKDLEKTIAIMREKAGNDSTAKSFVAGFESSTMAPGGSVEVNHKVAKALARNHDALEGCLKTLKANAGKYTVSDSGDITFSAGTPDSAIIAYNKFVETTTETMEEINSLEAKRAQMINQNLAKMPK